MLVPLVALLALSGAPKVVILEFTGAGAKPCEQMITALLKRHTAVLPAKQWHGGRRPAKAEDIAAMGRWIRERAASAPGGDALISGAVHKKSLRLDVYGLPGGELIGLKTFEVGKACKLETRQRLLATSWLQKTIEGPRGVTPKPPAAAEEEVAAAPEPVPSPPEVEGPAREDEQERQGLADALRADSPPERETVAVEEEAPEPIEEAPFLTLEVGVAMSGRTFDYVDPLTSNLRPYKLSAMPAPGVGVEARPVREALPGLVVRGDYRRSFGVSSVRTEGGAKHPTVFQDLGLALAYRWEVEAARAGLVAVPRAGVRYTSFALSEADDGTEEVELPDVAYTSVELGLTIEYPVGPRFTLFGGGAFLPLLGAGGDLVSPAFFRGAGGNAVEVEGGVAIRVWSALGVSLAVRYTRYALTFDSELPDLHAARGARDEYLSAEASARWSY